MTMKFIVYDDVDGVNVDDVDDIDDFDDIDDVDAVELGNDEDPIIKFRFIQRQTTADDDGD